MSKTVLTAPKRHFGSTPINGHHPTGLAGQFRAISGLMRCSKQYLYSITSSARFAVFILKEELNLNG